ncbi:MAG: DUF1648 domain-containing protein [Polyangiaceae bacterium]|nr:DUF1648 domain-containing protein [Polyangiaceae bacterium]
MKTEKKLSVADALIIGLLLVTFAVTAAMYGRLPDPMPTHFGVSGRPNGWMSRAWGAWLLPVLNAAVAALFKFGAGLLPREWRGRLEASPVRILSLITVAFLSAVHLLVLHAALSRSKALGAEIWVIAGVFFAAAGQILPRTRRNPFIGVRTTWTLTSDENWARTHRMAGYAFSVGGAVAVLAGLGHAPGLAQAALLAAVLVPVLWSWRLARRGV